MQVVFSAYDLPLAKSLPKNINFKQETRKLKKTMLDHFILVNALFYKNADNSKMIQINVD